MGDPLPKYARVNPQNPEAWGQCDRCSFWYALGELTFQTEWAGMQLYSLGLLVCPRCLDIPQEQLRTIVLPPDPPPIQNARPPNLTVEEDGPVQSILSASVAQGAMSLPVEDATGFVIGDTVWIQLINASFAQETLNNVDTGTNILTIASPLPAAAPINGVVSVSGD